MAKKIEVGMLVRIIDTARPGKEYLGHVGKVVGRFMSNFFEIEGAEPEKYAFRADCLQPIDPPQESDNIQETREQGAPSFSKMMEGLKQREEVE